MNPTTAKQFQKFLELDIEVGGSLDKNLNIKDVVYGDRYSVFFDQASAYNFHTHPIEPTILYSFYSVGDIIWALKRAAYYPKKEYLVTEDGIYCLEINPATVKLYKRYPAQTETILAFYQRYIIERKMNPFGYGVDIKGDWWELKKKHACDIQEMINLMNTTGQQLLNWLIEEIKRGKLSFRDQLEMASFVELPWSTIGKIYTCTFFPWGLF
jgi:hypothetical protein